MHRAKWAHMCVRVCVLRATPTEAFPQTPHARSEEIQEIELAVTGTRKVRKAVPS